jgi:hypothetical protein
VKCLVSCYCSCAWAGSQASPCLTVRKRLSFGDWQRLFPTVKKTKRICICYCVPQKEEIRRGNFLRTGFVFVSVNQNRNGANPKRPAVRLECAERRADLTRVPNDMSFVVSTLHRPIMFRDNWESHKLFHTAIRSVCWRATQVVHGDPSLAGILTFTF